ncbi:DUF4139 domain-containing protein, partial [Klebsiella pneumoniae]
LSSFAKAPLVVTVFDQIPVSQDTNILVKDVKTGEGTVNKQTGEVEWKVELKPQQVMELPLSYTLKYPKEKPISGL